MDSSLVSGRSRVYRKREGGLVAILATSKTSTEWWLQRREINVEEF
jgi:hypothetical protein